MQDGVMEWRYCTTLPVIMVTVELLECCWRPRLTLTSRIMWVTLHGGVCVLNSWVCVFCHLCMCMSIVESVQLAGPSCSEHGLWSLTDSSICRQYIYRTDTRMGRGTSYSSTSLLSLLHYTHTTYFVFLLCTVGRDPSFVSQFQWSPEMYGAPNQCWGQCWCTQQARWEKKYI